MKLALTELKKVDIRIEGLELNFDEIVFLSVSEENNESGDNSRQVAMSISKDKIARIILPLIKETSIHGPLSHFKDFIIKSFDKRIFDLSIGTTSISTDFDVNTIGVTTSFSKFRNRQIIEKFFKENINNPNSIGYSTAAPSASMINIKMQLPSLKGEVTISLTELGCYLNIGYLLESIVNHIQDIDMDSTDLKVLNELFISVNARAYVIESIDIPRIEKREFMEDFNKRSIANFFKEIKEKFKK